MADDQSSADFHAILTHHAETADHLWGALLALVPRSRQPAAVVVADALNAQHAEALALTRQHEHDQTAEAWLHALKHFGFVFADAEPGANVLDPDMWRRFTERARDAGTTPAAILRTLIAKYVEETGPSGDDLAAWEPLFAKIGKHVH